MNIENESEILAGRVIPPVKKLRVASDSIYRICDGCAVEITVKEDAEKCTEIVASLFGLYWNVSPSVSADPLKSRDYAPEEYSLSVNESAVRVFSRGEAGVRYALETLRQLAETERGVREFSECFLPCVEVTDSPSLAFRGIHFCWFPELDALTIEKSIRIAARCKFNYVVLESWGAFEYMSFPEYCWEGMGVGRETISQLVDLARNLGVTLIPQVNLFGHASGAPCSSGKHVLLDLHPDFASLFEPDGWSWCLSNPEVEKTLDKIVVETHDAFGNPPFFHIGCDEAYNAGSCFSCRHSDFTGLVIKHITHFAELLRKRGARAMMWHDMLISGNDSRWEGYTASADNPAEADRLLSGIPRDVVVCDWQYYFKTKDGLEPVWPTSSYFDRNGFDVLLCPWTDQRWIESQGLKAEREKYLGMLCTTWNLLERHSIQNEMMIGAKAAWCPSVKTPSGVRAREYFNRCVRDVCHDMGITEFERTGIARKSLDAI